MLKAITRRVSPALDSCQLEYFERQQIDVVKADEQHRAYENCLRELGVEIISLPASPLLPDSVFVEDPAIVLDEIAIIARPATETRRGEAETLARVLERFRTLKRIVEPGTLEGGDVLRLGKTLFVGLSRRTNRAGIDQLNTIVEPHGYKVRTVEVTACLHLKTACSGIGEDRVLANKQWIAASQLAGIEMIEVPPQEPAAANVLRIGNAAIMPAAFPRTADLLTRLGLKIKTIGISELAKAEAGVTCMSLLFHC